ncbi:uncharacterized protein EMH_0086040 [Eimeria mitis]|uniref:Sortilin C-terminal domain-containing protein n=1 Tax=Eimeria mitis TaxID=44415 RepID=U6K7F3_9EIME|nr:uncharacterized protein EMH_0086040 [Eimeria mitis]CDJ33869.1 hypothetical protein EMH_0086040 [Eimeria mitis]
MQDYECEYGFERAVGSVHCLPTDVAAAAASTAAGLNQLADAEDAAAAAACTSSAFFYTAAYRKVPGDVCEGGWVPEKVAVPCPAHSPASRHLQTFHMQLLGMPLRPLGAMKAAAGIQERAGTAEKKWRGGYAEQRSMNRS